MKYLNIYTKTTPSIYVCSICKTTDKESLDRAHEAYPDYRWEWDGVNQPKIKNKKFAGSNSVAININIF
jgi:hypothetical protein